jgi:hypothetical protein
MTTELLAGIGVVGVLVSALGVAATVAHGGPCLMAVVFGVSGVVFAVNVLMLWMSR